MKPTKRKAFNFLRSYFDVLNQLENDKDKLDFLLSIINKQFLDEDPIDLSFIVKLCYESQRHSIEKSVKGYKDKTKQDMLGNPIKQGNEHPKQDPYKGGSQDPYQQEKEEEQEKEKYIYSKKEFLENWNKARKHFKQTESNLNTLLHEQEDDLKQALETFSKKDIQDALKGLFMQEYVPQEVMHFKPKHFLKNIDTYLDAYKNNKKNLYKI